MRHDAPDTAEMRPTAAAAPVTDRRPTGLRRLFAAFGNSMTGLGDVWRREEAFRIEAVLLVVSVPAAFWIAEDPIRRAVLVCAVAFVMVVEVINSAIEATIDRIGPERHEKSRMAKDLGSFAVLLAVLMASILWGAAAVDRFWPG
jgi:diacylglycerol kinase (ATP)